MKKIIFILAAIISYSLLSCSQDEIKTYDGQDVIYYSNRISNNGNDIWWDSLKTFNFFFFPKKNDTLISLSVSSMGAIYDHDRIFIVEPESIGDAVEGLDFELAREQVMPAGKSKTNIYVKLLRRAEMEGKTFTVRVWLRPNGNFATNMPWGIDKNMDTVSRHYMDVMCQAELAAPRLYVQRQLFGLGYWSILKFNTINEYFDLTVDDWMKKRNAFDQNFNNYMIAFGNYLNRKIAEGPDAAIKDPSKFSERGYMTLDGYESSGIPATLVPVEFPTTNEWEGREK